MNQIKLIMRNNIQDELEWWRTYGEFIAVNYSHANAEAIEYVEQEKN